MFSRFILLLILCISSSFAQTNTNTPQTISLAAPYITNLIEEDGSGVYQRIFNEAISGINYQVKQSFSPYKRALLAFEKGHTDCIYSFTKVMTQKLGENKILASFPLGAFAYYMFTKSGRPSLKNPQELERLRVGAVYGHESYFRSTISEKVKLSMVSSDNQNIKKLSLNRIDALIGALPDLGPFLPQLSCSPKHPLLRSYDKITCYNSKKNETFLRDLNVRLQLMKETGRYEEISGDLFYDFDNEEAKQ